uniref:Uncharacterized protein n=1 Tax=Hemiselmis tepida TaxID=464990 RepID=A0A7S0VY23_9CRYP|mmetsp:Transcript_21769/g.54977  ORF Transcript_21769/g.54977 Transcript_21769/m.54977 type:complete len:141 (+) Transcript_21769:280-702(+)
MATIVAEEPATPHPEPFPAPTRQEEIDVRIVSHPADMAEIRSSKKPRITVPLIRSLLNKVVGLQSRAANGRVAAPDHAPPGPGPMTVGATAIVSYPAVTAETTAETTNGLRHASHASTAGRPCKIRSMLPGDQGEGPFCS